MKDKILNTLLCLVIIFGLFGCGFYFGRTTMKIKKEIVTEYIKGDTIRDTMYLPKPYKVIAPIDTLDIIKKCIEDGIYFELWPTKTITEYIEITKEDTTKIMADWATKRLYNENVFNCDTIGSCNIEAEVQYNRLRLLGYTFEPVTKQVTETTYKVNFFSPFVGVGWSTNPWDNVRNPMINLTGGFYIKEKYGIMINYQHAMQSKNDYVGGTILYKF